LKTQQKPTEGICIKITPLRLFRFAQRARIGPHQ
jgi:hypothetical protein